jgi:hypothetical protein
MATAKRAGGKREKALDQPAQQEDEGVRERRLPERMPQWRTGNPNNSGIVGDIMERVEERWQKEHKRDEKETGD